MELTDYMADSLDFARGHTLRTIDGLTRADLRWRPGPGCNSIGSILIHIGRTEDSFFHQIAGESGYLWDGALWHQKLGLSPEDRGWGYDTAPENAAPDLKLIVGYLDATHRYAIDALHHLDPARLSVIVHERLKANGAEFIRLGIHHESHHQGQIDYLKGLHLSLTKAVQA